MYDDRPTEDLKVSRDGQAQLKLQAPATAGYRWEVASHGAAVRIDRRGRAAGEAFGAASLETFDISLEGGEPAELVMVLKRPWEEDPMDVRRYRVTPER